MSKIMVEDVIQVAKSIKQTLTPKQIEEVLCKYEESEDNTGTWDLILEDCIYQVIADASPSPYPPSWNEQYI